MAAQSVVRRGYDDPIETYSSNVMGTVNLLEALRQLKQPCVVINVTSDKCYANREWIWGYREDEPMTLIAPSFNYEPWYGDNVTDPAHRMESFILADLVPFGDTFAQGSVPQRYLIGFSKSGTGVLSLILRHPKVFNAAAAWDSPAQLSSLSAFAALPLNFGTQANFDLYNIPTLVSTNADAFQLQNRLWISGDQAACSQTQWVWGRPQTLTVLIRRCALLPSSSLQFPLICARSAVAGWGSGSSSAMHRRNCRRRLYPSVPEFHGHRRGCHQSDRVDPVMRGRSFASSECSFKVIGFRSNKQSA